MPVFVLLPFVIVGMTVLGLVFSLFAYFPLKSRPPVSVFISTIALGIIFQNTANAIFGAAPRGHPPPVGGPARARAGVAARAVGRVIVVAAALIFGQWRLFARTGLGRQLRATAQDRPIAEVIGIR